MREPILLGLQIENFLKGGNGFLLYLFHGNALAKKRGEGNDLHTFETAGVDHVIVGEFRRHIERKPVKRNPPSERRCPQNPAWPLSPTPLDSENFFGPGGRSSSEHGSSLLQAVYEINDFQLQGFKKEYRIPEQLPRPVIGHVSAPLDGDAVNPLFPEYGFRNQDILLLGVLPEGENMGMLEKEQHVCRQPRLLCLMNSVLEIPGFLIGLWSPDRR